MKVALIIQTEIYNLKNTFICEVDFASLAQSVDWIIIQILSIKLYLFSKISAACSLSNLDSLT